MPFVAPSGLRGRSRGSGKGQGTSASCSCQYSRSRASWPELSHASCQVVMMPVGDGAGSTIVVSAASSA